MIAHGAAAIPPARRRVRAKLVLLVLIAIAPVVASYLAYYFWPRERQVNYGTLYAVPAPPITGQSLEGAPFALTDLRGKWVVLAAAPGTCDASCRTKLYAGRQARTIQNAERERVARVWLITDAVAPPAEVLGEHPDLVAVRTDTTTGGALPEAGHALYLVDPLGNLVLAWPADPDIKAMARDLARLLRASRIG
jgi:cytochrome oxidase Cu insertion factor (SCO1/SenC/PrrC family)